MTRYRIEIAGIVQGVGFRPFVYRLALAHSLVGCVRNTTEGVVIEVQGAPEKLQAFGQALTAGSPVAARLDSISYKEIPAADDKLFCIESSELQGERTASIPRDRAPCSFCLDEFYDPGNRRFHYPFITCNDCGPRFTITEGLPFDRRHTTMRDFSLCEACRNEYADPSNRRFHAQTNSCPQCGPELSMSRSVNGVLGSTTGEKAFQEALEILKNGGFLAIKGVGGYQLVCSAKSSGGIERIRHYKQRNLKPFALVAPTLSDVTRFCHVSAAEAQFLSSPVAPVMILYIKNLVSRVTSIHENVSPNLKTLGVMLPNNPILHRLVRDSGHWLVVTSANLRGEPMHTDDALVACDLASIVDGILSHNRSIAHVADDSVVRFAGDKMIVLRHARGLAPAEIKLNDSKDESRYVVGFGGHSKSSFALAMGRRCILSQHIGDLDSQRAYDVFMHELQSFEKMFGMNSKSKIIACDAHSQYGSSILASKQRLPLQTVFHHEAHLASLLAEKGFEGRALGFVCDGTGLGRDGSIWGGEFFVVDGSNCHRVGSLLPFRLPGGELAIRDPRRSALGLLYKSFGQEAFEHPFTQRVFEDSERAMLTAAITREINAPLTTSLGRLFDGLAVLSGTCLVSEYEAHAAMELESIARDCFGAECDGFSINWIRGESGHWYWDWRNVIGFAEEAAGNAGARSRFASMFHNTVVNAVGDLSRRLNIDTVLLTGGVFQNALLVERASKILGAAHVTVLTQEVIPPGDGGLALGQVASIAMREL